MDEAARSPRTPSILAIDDERSILELIRTLLASHDLECAVIEEPAQAFRLLRREPVDLLICDAQLHDGSPGDPVAEALRVDPRTPVILTTRHRAIGPEPQPRGNGVYDCLRKPFELGRLPNAVLHALERRRLLRENEQLKDALSIHRIGQAVEMYLEERKAFDALLKSARMAVSADRAALYAGRAGSGSLLELGSEWWPDDARTELVRTIARRVTDGGSPLRLPDARGQALGLPAEVQSLAAVPVHDQEGSAGALVVLREKSPLPLTDEHLRVLQDLAAEAADLMTRRGTILMKERPLDGPAAEFIRALVARLDRLEHEPPGHSLRIAEYALRLAAEVGMSASERSDLKTAALLHDVGKVGVRAAVLTKRGPLTENERREIERHSEIGATILESVGLSEPVVDLVRYHHERFDGHGYPSGLRGVEIPFGARILAIADTFEAMTCPRPYRAALRYDDVVEEISRRHAVRFDPELVRAFLRVPRSDWEQIRAQVAEAVAAVERDREKAAEELEGGDRGRREERAL